MYNIREYPETVDRMITIHAQMHPRFIGGLSVRSLAFVGKRYKIIGRLWICKDSAAQDYRDNVNSVGSLRQRCAMMDKKLVMA